MTASQFENNFASLQKKKQVLDFIGGGVYPTKYFINKTYDKLNQKRVVQVINLNDIFKEKENT